MPQFRVLKRSTRERIYVDKIDRREHLHITGVEFTDSMMKSMSSQPQNGSNMFKQESEPVVVVESTDKVVTIEPEKTEIVIEKVEVVPVEDTHIEEAIVKVTEANKKAKAKAKK